MSYMFNNFDGHKDNISCSSSPERLKTVKSKRLKQDCIFVNSPVSMLDHRTVEFSKDHLHMDENKTGKVPSYVPQSASYCITLPCYATILFEEPLYKGCCGNGCGTVWKF